MKKIFVYLLVTFSCLSFATEDQMTFENEQQEALYKELIKELRCPKCQNQNIADSNAVVAKDMRVKTKELVDQGQDKEQVIDYMVNRYGQFAHYQPPLNAATSLLWILPISFVLLAIFLLVRRSSKSAVSANQAEVDENDAINQELDKELEQLMAEEGKDK